MDDGQRTPRGHPDFNSYVKILCVSIFWTDRHSDRDIDPVWASLTTFLQVNTTPAAWMEELFSVVLERFLVPFTLCVCIARIRLEIHVHNI
jgi:hypothetical protein